MSTFSISSNPSIDAWRLPFNRPSVVPSLVSSNIVGGQNYGLLIAKFVWPLGSAGLQDCDHREVKIEVPCILHETYGYVDLRRVGTFEYRQIDSFLGEELPIPGRVTSTMFDGMHEALRTSELLLDPAAVIRAASEIYCATRTSITNEPPKAFSHAALISGI